jgi:DNA polymerase-1
MILQGHDELIFEVPLQEKSEVETLVREQMEGVIHLKVPLVADVGFGPNWRDL